MKLVEFPKGKGEHESAREFLTTLTELVDKGEYKPSAFVVLVIEDNAMVPLGINLTKHEIISYLAVAKHMLIDSFKRDQ